SHAGSVVGSTRSGPVCGHVPLPKPPSHVYASSHAPVVTPSSGFTHGTQRSSSSHVSCGRLPQYDVTSGMQPERHTPSAARSDVHDGGVYTPPVAMSGSGTQ